MTQRKLTLEQYHSLFYDYLMKKFDGNDEEVKSYMETAERILPQILNDYFGTKYESIYEIQDGDEIEVLRKRIKTQPVLKDIDKDEEPRYTEVLKWYRLFVKSLNNNDGPIPVPGEHPERPNPEDKPSSAADPSEPVTTLTTIFLEGEAEEAQPEEIRKRNKKLRQTCINYFKTLHNEHIVCECCGFEFSRAYDIDDYYIEVHHRFPFAHTEGEHPVNAITDLVPLCANCHRMIHHGQGGRGNCMSFEELKKKFRGKIYTNN